MTSTRRRFRDRLLAAARSLTPPRPPLSNQRGRAARGCGAAQIVRMRKPRRVCSGLLRCLLLRGSRCATHRPGRARLSGNVAASRVSSAVVAGTLVPDPGPPEDRTALSRLVQGTSTDAARLLLHRGGARELGQSAGIGMTAGRSTSTAGGSTSTRAVSRLTAVSPQRLAASVAGRIASICHHSETNEDPDVLVAFANRGVMNF